MSSGFHDRLCVAVVGSTRAGKSTFLKVITGDPKIKINDSILSEPHDEEVIVTKDIIFISGPGFDDSRRSKAEILTSLLKSLTIKFESKKMKFDCLLYFQTLETDKFGGSDSLTVKTIKALVGQDEDTKQNKCPIYVVFTKGDIYKSVPTIKDEKIKEFKKIFQRDMGVEVFFDTQGKDKSNYDEIISRLTGLATNRQPTLLQYAEDMGDNGATFNEIGSGRVLLEHMQKEIRGMKDGGADVEPMEKKLEEVSKTKISWTDVGLKIIAIPIVILVAIPHGVGKLFGKNLLGWMFPSWYGDERK